MKQADHGGFANANDLRGTHRGRGLQAQHLSGQAGFTIQVTYVVMLALIGTYMFYDSLSALRAPKMKMK